MLDSHEWGGETGIMFKLASAFNAAVATMLIDAAQIAGSMALQSVRNGWPLLVVEVADDLRMNEAQP